MTGDGILALFDGPALAIRCGAEICRVARDHDLQVRVGVHVGEVELAGATVHGVCVHEAARIMSAAGADEVVVSDVARTLALGSGLEFDDLGVRELKGLDEPRRLFVHRA